MTLEEAIKHCLEVAEKAEVDANYINLFGEKPDELGRTLKSCIRCANEHRQLAEWLKDYKRLLAKESGVDIRCGNCKYDETQEMCDKCYVYSAWESNQDE